MTEHGKHWHHAPAHYPVERGTYMVTAGTYLKQHFFPERERLAYLHDTLLATASEYGWELQAWAVFPNHYHFIGISPGTPNPLKEFLRVFHGKTANQINKLDAARGRKIWYQYYDTHLTYERSYFARLHYVHANAVHHRLVLRPSLYPWCSAARFESEADSAFQNQIYSMPIDNVNVADEF